MHVCVYNIDDVEAVCVDAAAPTVGDGVVPIRAARMANTCKLVWEGDMDVLPSFGDTLCVPTGDDGGYVYMYVYDRIVHLVPDPFWSVLVSYAQTDEEEEYAG